MKPIGSKSKKERIDDDIINRILEHIEDSNIHTSADGKKNIESITSRLRTHIKHAGIHITREKQSEWDSKETIAGSKAKSDRVAALIKLHVTDNCHVSKEEKDKMLDKYTRNEVDNKIAACTNFLQWLPPVSTTREFNEKYLNTSAKEGDFVYINAESHGRRFTNGKWEIIKLPISPLATEDLDGRISSEDYKKLASIEANANNYIHPDDSETRHVTDEQIRSWDNKANNNLVDYFNAGLMSPDDKMVIDNIRDMVDIKVDGKSIPQTISTVSNTITIGPEHSGANYICDENTSLSEVFHTIVNNKTFNKIVLLYNPNDYFTDEPIVITKSDIEITSEIGVTINNRIDESLGNKFILSISGDNNTISNITFNCSNTPASAKYGCILVSGSNNTINKVTTISGAGIVVSGYSYNTITNCTCNSNQNAIELASNATRACTYNRVENNNIMNCVNGIVLSTFKNANSSNIISNNIITNCNTGIYLYNNSNTYKNTPEYNIISNNIISRGLGRSSDYGTGQYTILVCGVNNVLTGNVTRGKGIDDKFFQSTIANNIQ